MIGSAVNTEQMREGVGVDRESAKREDATGTEQTDKMVDARRIRNLIARAADTLIRDGSLHLGHGPEGSECYVLTMESSGFTAFLLLDISRRSEEQEGLCGTTERGCVSGDQTPAGEASGVCVHFGLTHEVTE